PRRARAAGLAAARAPRAASGSARGAGARRARAPPASAPPRRWAQPARRLRRACSRRRLPLELRLLDRALQRERRALRRDRLRDQVEVARAGLALVPRRGVAELLELELVLLEPHVRRHLLLDIAVREL